MRRADRGVVLGLHRHDPDPRLLEHALNLGIHAVDTAHNYQRFHAHHALRRAAGELLGEFEVSSKIGYFPHPDGSEHSLDRDRLRRAAEQITEQLGQTPTTLLLHNPETTLTGVPAAQAHDLLVGACATLAEATEAGWCARWGIASWDARPVLAALGATEVRPDVVLLRAGLTVSTLVLEAGERLVATLGLAPDRVWGMSPFGGSTTNPVWRTVDLAAFLGGGQPHTGVQAAFRLAFELPAVARVAVGTGNQGHLDELVDALSLTVREDAVTRYRGLIRSEP